MRWDRFSAAHPAVSFLFFLGAIVLSGLIQHPAYVLSGMICAGFYYCLLNDRKSWKRIMWLFLLFLLLSAGNPLLNHQGSTVLTRVFGKPYTLEALLYGASLAGVLVSVLLWAGCYNAVMTSDKFTMLFGNLAPALSLLLVMVLRLIPSYFRKMRPDHRQPGIHRQGEPDGHLCPPPDRRGHGAVRHDLLGFGVRGDNGGFHAWPGLRNRKADGFSALGLSSLGLGTADF